MEQRGASSSHFSFLSNGFCLLTKSEAAEESFLFLLSIIKFNSIGAGTKTQPTAQEKAMISPHGCLWGQSAVLSPGRSGIRWQQQGAVLVPAVVSGAG